MVGMQPQEGAPDGEHGAVERAGVHIEALHPHHPPRRRTRPHPSGGRVDHASNACPAALRVVPLSP
jgi:hypothetical protein